MTENGKRRLVIITGLSGAGKSTVLNAFEDCGFETMDNLPLPIVEDAIKLTSDEMDVAIGLDSRTQGFSAENCERLLKNMARSGCWDVELIFLDAQLDVLLKRFSETRRKHPLSFDGPIEQGIAIEQDKLAPLRPLANTILDTSNLKLSEARMRIKDRYQKRGHQKMIVSVVSFGFSNGIPRNADLVFDVRFLRNPHYETDLRGLTGQSSDIIGFIKEDPSYKPFLDHLSGLIAFLLPRYSQEGKSYLTIAFGCTGGKHRSVMMAEQMAAIIDVAGIGAQVVHRDIPTQ